jgi:Leucine-rich repeat (LRR) protein
MSLKKLVMQACEALEEFPLGLSNLSMLEELDFPKCMSLKHIPEGFGGLTSLKKLYMWECEALEEFPLGLSNLSMLEEIDFSQC